MSGLVSCNGPHVQKISPVKALEPLGQIVQSDAGLCENGKETNGEEIDCAHDH